MSSTHQWFFLGAAVAAAAVGIISAIGMFVKDQYKHEQVRHKVERDFARMNEELAALKREMDRLKSRQKQKTEHKKVNRSSTKSTSALSITSDDYTSALEVDSSDLEFYDVSDDEEASLANGFTTTSLHKLYTQIDSALESDNIYDIKDVVIQLHDLCKDYKEVDLYWRLARAYYLITTATSDQEVKMINVDKGLKACNEALALDQNSSNAHKWYALLIGSRSDYLPLKERIKDGYIFKEHIDKAIDLDPNDSTLYHLLGRFSYEVAGLKWYERKAATALFAEPPNATYEEALDNFMSAERLSKNEWKENKLLISKCHIALNNYKDAIKWLDLAHSVTDNDGKINEEVLNLMEKYNSYR